MDTRYRIEKGRFTDAFDINGTQPPQEMFDDWDEDQLAALGTYLIAVDNNTNEKVGYVHGAENAIDGRWIKMIFVKEMHRRRGIGTELTKSILANFTGDETIYATLLSEEIHGVIDKIDDDRLKIY